MLSEASPYVKQTAAKRSHIFQRAEGALEVTKLRVHDPEGRDTVTHSCIKQTRLTSNILYRSIKQTQMFSLGAN